MSLTTAATVASASSTTATGPEWVQCDRCKKWRKLPPNVNSSSLPDQWFCEMNTWAPRFASCSAPQEEEESSSNAYRPTVGAAPRLVPAPGPTARPTLLKLKRAEPTPSTTTNGGTAPQPVSEEKRYRFEDSTKPQQDVTIALKSLAGTLQETIETVANYSGGDEDEETLFRKLNEIVMRLEKVSKSAVKPLAKDEAMLKCSIPRELLEFLDRPNGQNHPSLYTEMILRGVLVEHERMENATSQYQSLLKDLGNDE